MERRSFYSTEVGSTAVQKYRGTVTRYFFSTVIGNVGTVFGTVVTFLARLRGTRYFCVEWNQSHSKRVETTEKHFQTLPT